ncbi:LemA protein [Candidatus Defluviicoccus seviourii]|uniref:LemA protein n=1 Tax=Candidatus Defluviicoccus seviourii TaxID=2565273 RepID=A0A564WCS7_9PROT|nr:LemA protein [Candidatus Defluviicoccus seviourii]
MSGGAILIGAIALALVIGYLWYATIVARRNKVTEALGSIDVHLRQRHELIPNVVRLAGRFMEHERGLMEAVTRLRVQADQALGGGAGERGRLFEVENAISREVGRLLVAVENYPDLKSDTQMLEAQRTWTETEAQLTAAQRFYNAAVNQLNNAVQIFPGPVLARLAGVAAMPFFKAEAEARVAPDVDRILPSAADAGLKR